MELSSIRADLHLHTNVSDGTDTPEQLIEKVGKAGIEVFSATDHDAVKAGRIIVEKLKKSDPRFIPGVEFSCRDEEGKYHVLGYGADPYDPEIEKLVEYGHSIRMKKFGSRIEGLKEQFGFSFSDAEIEELLSLDNPGKPHLGLLMVKKGYAPSKEEAIQKYINAIKVKSEYLRPEDAVKGILSGGWIPVLAHPFYGSGDELILGIDMEKRLARLVGYGLKGVEAFYSGFSSKMSSKMLSLADKYGLFVTAGSDYHGVNKLVAIGDTGLEKGKECPERLRAFLETFGIR